MVLALTALLLSLLFAPAAANAAVSTATSVTASGTGSASAEIAVDGSNRLLAVGVSTLESATVTSVTYGAQVLTRREAAAKDSSRAELWTLVAPNPGSANVVVTLSTGAPVVIGAVNLNGVDQQFPNLGSNATNGNNGANSASLVLNGTVEADGMFGVLTVNDASNITAIRTSGSADTVVADKRWDAKQGTVLSAGATRRGWTMQNMSLYGGINWFWNRIDPSHLMPHSYVIAAFKAAAVVKPTVTSPTATSVTHNSATLGGTMTDTGGGNILDRGVVYCVCTTPEVGGPGVSVHSGTPGAFTAAVSALTPSTTYTYRAYATNGAGTGYSDAATFRTAAPPNLAPTADAGGPYTIDEGDSLTLAGSGTDPEGAPLQFAWDLNGDGQFEDATGATPTLTRAQLAALGLADGPVTRNVRLAVSDGVHVKLSNATTLTVNNVAPTATLTGDTVSEGASATVAFSDQADPGDSSFSYEYAVDGGAFTPGGSSLTLPTTDGPATIAVKGAISDKDGGRREYSTTVRVNNAAPTAKLADVTVDEGETATIGLTDTDDVATDLAAGLRYAYDFDDDGTYDFGAPSYAAATSASTATLPAALTADGPASRTVRVAVIDKDGGLNAYTAQVTVRNVAPSATLTNSGPIDEGQTAQVSWAGVTDPSTADAAAGTTYRYDFDNDGTWDVSDSALAAIDVPATFTADSGTQTIRAAVVDKDGGEREYTTELRVENVAPTATLTGSTVAEGSDATVTFSDADDVSAADKKAGFTYTYRIGEGESTPGGATLTIPTTDGPATIPVTGTITDKDGGRREYSTTVKVENVAPTATLTGDAVDEGEDATVAFTGADDVSAADKEAGFTYEWDVDGAGFKPGGATLTVPTTVAKTIAVKGAIIDKDGGRREYSTTVEVGNLAPTVTITGPDAVPSSGAVTLTFASKDAGPLTGTIDWGDGTVVPFASGDASHTYTSGGAKTITARVTDASGAEATATHTLTVATVSAPHTPTPETPAAPAPAPAPGGGVLGAVQSNIKITGVRVTPRCVFLSEGLTAVSAASKTIKVQFRVNAAANVKFSLKRWKKTPFTTCPPATGIAQEGGRKLPGVYSPFNNRPVAAKRGLNTVTLATTGKGKTLKPGTYLLTITAGDAQARTKVWVLAG